MPETSTLIHFVLLGACAVGVAAVIGTLLHKIRLSYLAGLVCGMAVGLSGIVSLFLEVGLAYPPERDWHHIIWAMLVVSFAAALIQVGRWQGIVDALILMVSIGVASQFLVPDIGADELFDEHRLFWLSAPPIAAAANIVFLRLKTQDGAAGWGLWVVVAQLAIISVALMLSYGTLAGVALGVTAMAVVLAITTSALYLRIQRHGGDPTTMVVEQSALQLPHKKPSTNILWLQAAIVPIGLAAILLTICVRTYSYGMIAGWVYIPMLFLPTIVCAADAIVFRSLHLGRRALIAGSLTTVISATSVIYMAVTSGPGF